MSARTTHDEQVLPLVTLVRQQVDASGLPSLREFCRVRGIKYGTLRRYYSKSMEPLTQGMKPDTAKALATALDVPLSQVQRAADQSTSRLYARDLGPGSRVLIGSPSEMTEEEIEQTVAELQKLLNEMRAEGGGS